MLDHHGWRIRVLLFSWLLSLVVFLFPQKIIAETIEFPDEELAKESVTPIFDQNDAVKKRTVVTSGKAEVGLFGGGTLNDPFFNSYPLGGHFTYHLSEYHAIGVVGAYTIRTKSSYATQLQSQTPEAGDRIKLDTMPSPRYYGMALYEFTPYYGKLSFSKQSVSNLSLSFSAAAGTINLGDDSSVNLAFGMNQRLFLSKKFGFRASLEAFLYQQKDYVQRRDDTTTLEKKNLLTFIVSGGIVYLL